MLVRKGCPDNQRTSKRITYVGDIFRKGDHYLEVIACGDKRRVEIECLATGWRTWIFSSKLHQDCGIGHPYKRSVMGKGYIGAGSYFLSDKIVSDLWRGVVRRSCDERYRGYTGCALSKDWECFQNFASWYYSQHRKNGINYDIDKDVLSDERLYSSDTCLLIPSYINRSIVDKMKTPVKSVHISGWLSYGRYFEEETEAMNYSYFCKSEYLSHIIAHSLKQDEIDLTVCLRLINYIKRKFPHDFVS